MILSLLGTDRSRTSIIVTGFRRKRTARDASALRWVGWQASKWPQFVNFVDLSAILRGAFVTVPLGRPIILQTSTVAVDLDRALKHDV